MELWEMVREHHKWKALESADDFTGGLAKRSKTSSTTHSFSSDSHTGIDLNYARQYEEPVQYIGRDRAKNLAKIKLKDDVDASSGTNVDQVMEKLFRFDNTPQNIAETKK